MNKNLVSKKFFQQSLVQYILLFIVFIILASIFLHMSIAKINTQLPQHIDAYLVSWVWSWENHILLTNPLNLFNANIFAPFKNTLAYSETMLGSFLLAWPILLVSKNVILAYNLVVLLSFAISGLGMYLLAYYLTRNKLAAILAALIYAFAPYKLIHSVGHLHLTGMWLPYVFLYLHKFFKKQTWKNICLLTLFIILVFLTGFHYFIFLPIVILIFLAAYYTAKSFKFNKTNIKKIILSFVVLFFAVIPIIYPYIYLKQKYNFFRTVESIEAYSPNLINYLIPPFLYNFFYKQQDSMELAVGLGLVIIILFIFSLWYLFKIKKNKLYNTKNKTIFLIYFIILFIAFIISFGFYIRFNKSELGGLPTFYALFYLFMPGFESIRAVGRYSVFILLSVAIFISYGFSYFLQSQRDLTKKIVIYFIVITCLFSELAFVPVTKYSTINLLPGEKELFNWIKQQPAEKIFLHLPVGFKKSPLINLDIIYVFESRLYFRKIVNGYSGQNPPNYLNLVEDLNKLGPQRSLPLLKKFKVNYLIFHFDYYKNSDLVKNWYLRQLSGSKNIKYITHFGNNYVYEVVY